ncbi:MAG: beta strand repeat-containing protein, partial [Bacteroidia bacterium]
ILFVLFEFAQAQTTKTVGIGGNYTTLKTAFDSINSGAITGNITLQIISNTTETASVLLNASGTGNASYTSVYIYPTFTGLTITGNIAAPLIDLNGADFVTIDGRVSASGSLKELTIVNTSIASTVGTSTIRFNNDATSNTIKYCTIKGSSLDASAGIIFIGNTAFTTGNDYITIDNNNLTNADVANENRPINTVYSAGTNSKSNDNITISNNNIYNFLNKAYLSNGISFGINTTTCNIIGNSFYETTTFSPIAGVAYSAIKINNSGGNGFVVLGNYIGGSSSLCGGTAFTKTATRDNIFFGINLNVGDNPATSVQNNTIQNIVWSDSGSASWTGIQVTVGSVNIGTTSGNTIGNASGTGSITVTGGNTGKNVYGINLAGSGTIVCQNNTIASIVVANANSAFGSNLYAINRSNNGNSTFSYNTIGSISQANSLQSISLSSANPQSVFGIFNSTGGTITIINNTIANLTNFSTNTDVVSAGVVNGIASSYGVITIRNNNIFNLKNCNANNSSASTASVSGIVLTSTNALNTITGNTIYNLTNNYESFNGSVIGVFFGATGMYTTNSHIVSNNFIYGLEVTGASSTNASLYGIKINTGQTSYINNIISIRGNTTSTIYGIFETGTASNNNTLYYNTIYIGGNPTTGSLNSYDLYSDVSNNTRIFKNNIFVNARSNNGALGKHFAAYFNYGVSTGLTMDYNDYYVSGTGGMLGYYNSVDVGSVPIISGLDTRSININPAFINANGIIATNFTPTSDKLEGTTINTVSLDYSLTNRAATPTQGAFEVTLNLNIDVYKSNVFQASYSTLKSAFDKINLGSHTGALEIRIKASTTETASAVLYQSGYSYQGNTSSYSSILIYPTIAGVNISGNFDAATIDLSGADNIIIDGRVGSSGSTVNMNITNSLVSTYAAAIRLTNSAENNLIKYCTIKGSCNNAGVGVVYFASAAIGNGNDNNILEYCNITNMGGNRPYNAIFSSGGSGRENSGVIIRNNNIYDIFNASASTTGLNISFNSTDWIVSQNSFYETAIIAPTGIYSYYMIRSNTGNNNLLSNNYLGGSSPMCGGSPMTIKSNTPHYFCALFINGVTGAPCIVQNNLIANIDYTSVEDNPLDLMFLNSGDINVIGNTIGATTGTGSITITTPLPSATTTLSGDGIATININGRGKGYTTAPLVTFSAPPIGGVYPTATAVLIGDSIGSIIVNSAGSGYTSAPSVIFDGQSNNYSTTHGIINASFGTVLISSNNFGSITTVGSNYYSHGFETLYNRAAAGTTTITNNLIGSLTTANSIFTSSPAVFALQKQDIYGFYNANGGTTIISGNTIANITNGYKGTNGSSRTRPIAATAGSNIIQNNIIRDIISSSGQTGTMSTAAVIGISVSATLDGTTQTISGNKIYNLNNTHPTAQSVVYGIYYAGPNSGNNTVNGNFIHSLSFSSTNTICDMEGILFNNGLTTCSNNIISLGAGTTVGYKINGIWDESSATNNNNIYFNSIYIGGTVASGVTSSTAALWNKNNTSTRNYRNNILMNVRTGGTSGVHYAIRLEGVANLTIDNNDYYVTGTLLGRIGLLDKANLAAWKLGTLQDAHSLNTNPGFTNAGSTNALDYYTSASLPAISITVITTDYAGLTRGATPKMGALEVNNYTWQGGTSTDFGTASNWSGGVVPPGGADILFAATPNRNCVLDQNRNVGKITNTQSVYKLVVNGKQLTINDSLLFSNGAQIDASANSSKVVFASTITQIIPSGSFLNNTIDSLTINNINGLTLNGDLTINSGIALIAGNFAIGPNTLTFNGVVTAMTGTVTGGSSTNMIIGGSGATISMPSFLLNNLTINRASGVSLYGNLDILGTLTLTSGTLTVGSNTLTISGSSPIRTTGNIDASNAGATLIFNNVSAITLPTSIFAGAVNNITLNGAGGIIASNDFTVNGVLYLAASNPSLIKGILDMGVNILTMGANATTIGIGDVTGIVKRLSFVASTAYSFGNQFTTMTFAAGGTMPNDVSLKIGIGTAPLWKSDAVNRVYDIVRTGGSGTTVTLSLHYLDGELQGNTESNLIIWDYHTDPIKDEEHGKSNQSTTDNWVAISNRSITYFGTSFDTHRWYVSNKASVNYIWQGQASSDWNDINNWSAGAVPSSTCDVVIPDAATTANDPVLPTSPSASVKTITIQPNGILNGGDTTSLTIAGSTGAWLNEGIFNSGTSTIIFTNANATMADPTNFYNLTINSGASLTLGTNNIMRIAGALTNNGTLRAALLPNTIEFNGSDQTIINPNGLTPGYYNLILSGSGTKTMPSSALAIAGNFLTSGTATATANNSITITGDVTIEQGSTFVTSAYNHNFGGNFHNQGTFTATTGSTITMNGSSSQMINGGMTTDFYNLTINNNSGVNLFSNANVNNTLTLITGNLDVGADTLSINGTINKTSGFIQVDATSSLSFGSSSALTLPNNLFTSNPSINNLTINKSGGLTLGNQNMTINGILNLTSGDFNLGTNTLTINGVSPIRTSGTIDASNSNATLCFSNPIAVVLPASIFSNNVNNMSITGTGGVTASSDFTINGILNLQNANPSDIKGSLDMGEDTLTMGALATTIGIGDVTGYVKRTSFLVNTPYSFGNEYTTINLAAGGTLPSRICVNIVLTPTHTWKSNAINRYYDISQTGGNSSTLVILNLHYLSSELNGANKNNLDVFDYHVSDTITALDDHGRSNDDIVNNWVGVANRKLTYIAPKSTFPSKFWTLGTSTSSSYTWLGANSSDWTNADNWVGGVPHSGNHAFIPDASTTLFSPMLPNVDTTTLGSLTIEPGGILNVASGYPSLTLNGSVGAWDNMGTFNPGNSTVIFTNANATISDPTNFYNLSIANGAKLTLGTNNIIRIAGTLTFQGSGVLNAAINENIVEFNGSETQNIPNPNGSTPGYHNLILSGEGTKILPSTLDIVDEFTNNVNGTVDFGTGTVALDGNSLYGQEISGSTPSNFYNLVLNNSGYGASLSVNSAVAHTLELTNGKLTIGNNDLTLGSLATITGGSSSNYIITNGSGLLIQRVNNDASDVIYPIGLESEYLPLTIKLALGNGTAADDIKARVSEGLYSAYNSSDIPTGNLILNRVVTKTWYLKEATAGGSNATIKLQWNALDQTTNFDNSKCNISHYTGNSWKCIQSSAVTGGDPYTQTISGITSFSPFGVFDQQISGSITYNNQGNTPLTSGVTVKLYQDNNQVGSDYTVNNGTYVFKGLSPGIYELRASSTASTAGSVNTTDAAQVNAWGVNPYVIENGRFYAGDVKGNNYFLNSSDAQRIQQNFVNGTAFESSSNWIFWKVGEATINSNTLTAQSTPTVTLENSDLVQNMYGLCMGDFNRSFRPNLIKSSSTSLNLINTANMQVSSNEEFDLLLRVMGQYSIASSSLVLNFPDDLVEIQDVVINTVDGTLQWSVNGNELRIGWYSSTPINL